MIGWIFVNGGDWYGIIPVLWTQRVPSYALCVGETESDQTSIISDQTSQAWAHRLICKVDDNLVNSLCAFWFTIPHKFKLTGGIYHENEKEVRCLYCHRHSFGYRNHSSRVGIVPLLLPIRFNYGIIFEGFGIVAGISIHFDPRLQQSLCYEPVRFCSRYVSCTHSAWDDGSDPWH